MGIVSGFLKQKCNWRQRAGEDETGQPVYGDPVEIPCRWVKKATFVPVTNGSREDAKISAQNEVMMSSLACVGDTLEYDEGEILEVKGIKNIVGLSGVEEGRFCYC